MVIFNDIQTIFYPSFVVIIQRHQGNVSASTGLWLPVGGGAESRIQSEFHVVLIMVRCECTVFTVFSSIPSLHVKCLML